MAGWHDWAAAIWIAGIVVGFSLAWRAQAAFERDARAGLAGPAVSGILTPRVIMPARDPYSDHERVLIRAHEREHVRRGDPKANALAAGLQVLFWFNPLVHLGARLMRMDQELACDAATLQRFPRARRLYAEALLKTELVRPPLPLGCRWPSASPHPLELRLAALKGQSRSDLLGPVFVAVFTVAVSALVWTAKPAVPPPMPREWPVNDGGPVTTVLLITMPPAAGGSPQG